MAKRSSDLWVASPEVNVQVRDLVRVVGIVASFAPRVFSIRGKSLLTSPTPPPPQGINGHRRPVPGAPSSGTSREARQCSGTPKQYTRSLVLPSGRHGT